MAPEESETPQMLTLNTPTMNPRVLAVHSNPAHTFSKTSSDAITLVAGRGVEGDAHAGVTVKHRSRVARDPSQPNLRQVHLLQIELLEELATRGFDVQPGEVGENLTTRGIDLLALPAGTRLKIGPEAVIEITGLRDPCAQLDDFQPGLMSALIDRAADGEIVRKAGVMGIVLRGGRVAPGDPIVVELPEAPHLPLRPV